MREPPGEMDQRSSERGQAAVAVIGVVLALVLCAVGAGVFLRSSLARERAAGTADGAALAAAAVMRDRGGELLPRRDARSGRALPPLLSRHGLAALAQAAAVAAAEAGGGELVALAIAPAGHDDPASATVTIRMAPNGLPRWIGASSLAGIRLATARAVLDDTPAAFMPDRFRAVDLRGFAGAAAVIAAASAQLGWPYLWGGESRAEGGFDCSGLVDYALAAAGIPVGRATAAGLQGLATSIPLAEVGPGDLVFVGAPAHHVGLVVAAGLAIEAPHRGSVVHYEPLDWGGWTSAGRLAALAGEPSVGDAVPPWVPTPLRRALLAAGREDELPVGLLAAQIEAESGFDATSVSAAGALGLAQFLPSTWSGSWNPWRAQSPLDPGAAIHARARYLRRLVDRADGDLGRALAAYHDGWNGSAHMPWSPVTRAYVARILRRFGGWPELVPGADLASMTAARTGPPLLRLASLGRVSPKG